MSQSQLRVEDPLNAFCTDTEAYLPGASTGPLAGLTFAAKDIFDVAGHVAGGGNPDWKATHPPAQKTAWVIQALVDAGATMVGKTHTDELTRGILGENPHYGTPTNPRAPGRVPGGSSSGSAAAVAGGLVDFALGSDTGGSVRIPSSFCGLCGMRPTHGRLPLDGILLQAPSYDTIGWFTRGAELFARVGRVLLQNQLPGAPSEFDLRRVIIAQDAFEVADKAVADALQPVVEAVVSLFRESSSVRLAPESLARWSEQQQLLQSREAWNTAADWISQVNPRFSFWVSDRYAMGRGITDEEVASATTERQAIIARIDEVTGSDGVICLPTSPAPALPLGQSLSERSETLARITSLTCMGGTTGRPQINLPFAEVEGLPVGLSLFGPRGSDEALIALAQQVESKLAP